MSQSPQDKTEAPTPKRRREAKEKGQVAKSQEVTTAALLLASAGIVVALAGPVSDQLLVLFAESSRATTSTIADPVAAAEWIRLIGWKALGAVAPALLLTALAAVSVNALQAKGVFSTKALAPEWGRLSPAKNLKRLFGPKPFADLAKSLLKLGVIATAVYTVVQSAWPVLAALPQQSPYAVLPVIEKYAVRVLLVAGSAYLVVAMADYGFQLWQFERNLRMSREEVKREQKDTEGDMMVKARLRSMGRSLARRRMFHDVPSADVVLTNPTHIAVALRYDPERAPAPEIVAMGQRKIAERIRAIAHDAGVPVIENKPLARALFTSGRIGSLVPPELYVAVAEVLAFVFRHRRRLAWSRPQAAT
ncbi:MAG: flagellar biosynthesis protein FlhB [Gemmatimonadetes bacterium]|nr:flagellar biosynthesis protein FlhB [Gemmatimonadota bacterium]